MKEGEREKKESEGETERTVDSYWQSLTWTDSVRHKGTYANKDTWTSTKAQTQTVARRKQRDKTATNNKQPETNKDKQEKQPDRKTHSHGNSNEQ